jgi:putative membrane protein
MGDRGFGAGWGWLFLALLVIGVVLVVVVLVRVLVGGTTSGQVGRSGGRQADRERARAILAERYARAEISTEEYQQRLQILDGD